MGVASTVGVVVDLLCTPWHPQLSLGGVPRHTGHRAAPGRCSPDGDWGVTAMGCTVGQGLSGMSTLSLTSVIAVAGIVVGALGGFRFQMWLVMRD